MFDLRFHAIVKRIFKWTEAPGCKFVNEHEAAMMKKNQARGFEDLRDGRYSTVSDREMAVYIAATYPVYFDCPLRPGSYIDQESRFGVVYD